MVKLVIVNGAPGSGKTTFEKMCLKYFDEGMANVISTIDPIKSAAKVLGWDGTKTPENRKFLSDLKDLTTQWRNLPFEYVKQRVSWKQNELNVYGIGDVKTAFIFCDCREPEEIEKFKTELNAITVFVSRESAESTKASNHADANVANYKYDHIINNNGTIDELENRARAFTYVLKNS